VFKNINACKQQQRKINFNNNNNNSIKSEDTEALKDTEALI